MTPSRARDKVYAVAAILLGIVFLIFAFFSLTGIGLDLAPYSDNWDSISFIVLGAFLLVGGAIVLARMGGSEGQVPMNRIEDKPAWTIPSPPPSSYTCVKCGEPLVYVPEYQRWYCNSCRAYA